MKDKAHGECHFYEKSMYSENVEREQRDLNRMHESNAPSQENADKFHKPNGHSNVQPGPAGGK